MVMFIIRATQLVNAGKNVAAFITMLDGDCALEICQGTVH
jgi:hypothetical protein